MQCVVETNHGEGNFTEIKLENITHYIPQDKVKLQHYKVPRDVIWAYMRDRAPFPIANFNSRQQRDNVFKYIHERERLQYTEMYEQVFIDAHAFEYMKDYLNIRSYRAYFKKTLQQFDFNKLINSDVFTSAQLSYPDLSRLANGVIIPKASLPSVDNLQRSLLTPRSILTAGVTPRQFFTHIINETYNDNFSV